MSTKIVIPSLGLTMEDAIIAEWLKLEGDIVEKEEPLLMIETDKATQEVIAPASGILGNIIAQIGDVILVGGLVAEIFSEEEYANRSSTSVSIEVSEVPTVSAAADQTVPAVSEEPVRKAMDFYEIAEEAPKPRATASPVQQISQMPAAQQQEAAHEGMLLRASPAARKLARDLGIDLSLLAGTGPEGRIIEANVRAYEQTKSASSLNQPAASLSARVEPASKMRKIIAERMVASRQTTASVTLTASFRMDEVVRLRQQINQNLEKRQGYKVTFDAIFAKAAALALEEFPIMQAQWSQQGLQHAAAVHVGIAVALPDGLVVPVVTHAEGRSLFSISKEIILLADLARKGKLTSEQLQGGTFTISNLGMFPIGSFTPVINLPEAAILGIGGIREQAVVDNGAIAVGKVAEISLSFDHRIVDGAPAAAFLTRIKSLIEEPYQLFMEV